MGGFEGQCTAFAGSRRIHAGDLAEVVRQAKTVVSPAAQREFCAQAGGIQATASSAGTIRFLSITANTLDGFWLARVFRMGDSACANDSLRTKIR